MKKHSTLLCLSLSCLLIFAGCAQTPADDSSSTVDSHPTTKSTAVDVTTTIKPSVSTTSSTKADGSTTTDVESHLTTKSTAVSVTTTVKPSASATTSSTKADTVTSHTKKTANFISRTSDTGSTTTTEPSASTTTSKKTNTYTIKIAQEELHTAITMTLDKQAYAPDEIIHVTITNGTEDKIKYGPGFRILKPRNNGEYQIVHNSYGTNAVLYTVGKDSSKTDRVKLTHYQVESNQAYKMALNIDSKWVIADFQITDK